MKNTLILALVCLGFSLTAQAKELTWPDALSMAKQNNPAIKRSAETLKQAQLSHKRAVANFLPDLSASASATQSKTDPGDLSRRYSVGLSGSLSLFSGFSDIAELRVQEYNLKTAETNNLRTLADTVYDVRSSYINLLWAQETVSLLQDILNIRSNNYSLVQLKYESGSEDKGSMLRVEADKAQAELDLLKAQRYLKSASLQLSRALGKEEFSVIQVTGSFAAANVSLDGEPSPLVEKTPEYIAAFYAYERSKAELLSARSGYYPSLSLSGSTSKTGEEWVPDNAGWSVGLTLNYPFFQGGKNFINVISARAGVAAEKETFRQSRLQLAANIDSAYNTYLNSSDNVSVSEKYLAASNEQSKITTTKYLNGLVSYIDWYSVENDYISSMKSLLNAKRDAALGRASFDKVLGLGE